MTPGATSNPWPGAPGGPSAGVCVILLVWPVVGSMSFRPEKTQNELACSGPAVVFVLCSQVTPVSPPQGVPGGPFTSPASAPPAAASTRTPTEAATAIGPFISPLSVDARAARADLNRATTNRSRYVCRAAFSRNQIRADAADMGGRVPTASNRDARGAGATDSSPRFTSSSRARLTHR
jgi:hypothetical protein